MANPRDLNLMLRMPTPVTSEEKVLFPLPKEFLESRNRQQMYYGKTMDELLGFSKGSKARKNELKRELVKNVCVKNNFM